MASDPMNNYDPVGGPRRDSFIDDEDQVFNLPPVLVQYWYTIVRWRWLMAGIVATCIILGVTVTMLMSPEYTATAQLQIDRQQKQITNMEGLEADLPGQDMEFYATQYELLEARPLAERVASALNLYDNAPFLAAHGIDPGILEEEDIGKTPAQMAEERRRLVVSLLLETVEISPIRTSKLVDINYTSRDPAMSARIANQWAAAFIELNMERQFASTADAREFLEERLDVLRGRLEESERQVVLYGSESGIVTLDQIRDPNGRTIANRTLTSTTLEQLANELNDATAARIAAEARANSLGENTSEAVTSSTLATLREQRAVAAAGYAKMIVQFAPEYPAVIELREQLNAIDAAIGAETARITKSREQQYREAVERERELRNQVAGLRQALDTQNQANIQYAVYQREADTNRELYDALLQRYKEIGVAGTVGANNIAIVELAIDPDEPSSPIVLVNLLVSVLLGLGLAGGTAFALEQIDEGIREPSQIEPLLKLPLLGLTPMVDNADVIDEIKDIKSDYFDAYFSIRSSLAFSTSHGFPKSIAVTSSRPGEGKSSTSAALAIVLARTGKKVLLVDADLRSPSINTFFECSNIKGFSNYLAGEDNWSSLVQSTELDNVFVLTTGPIPPSAAELLSGDRLEQFVAESLAHFDHLVIDSPPVMGMTDAPLVANATEGVVYVVESAGPAVRGIRASIKRIKMANAHVFGVILTKVRSRSSGYGYGYGYGYRYGGEEGRG